jgi:cytochrome c biogenesis protein CcmG/thiol:disulfide interchange protein DsbE
MGWVMFDRGKLVRVVSASVILLLGLVACGATQSPTTSVGSVAVATAGVADVPTVIPAVTAPVLTATPDGPVAPDISVEDVSGKTVRLSDFRGKTVLLNFRATWCGYCRQEAPELQKAHESFPDLVIMSVNIQESPDKVVAYEQELKLTFAMYVDATGAAAQSYKVRGIPSSFFIDPEGHIFSQHLGPLTLQMVRSTLAGMG